MEGLVDMVSGLQNWPQQFPGTETEKNKNKICFSQLFKLLKDTEIKSALEKIIILQILSWVMILAKRTDHFYVWERITL